jgi:hypothetical protein
VVRAYPYAEVFRMRLRLGVQAFLDGSGFAGLFGPLRRSSAPESYFRRDEDEDAEADHALRGG